MSTRWSPRRWINSIATTAGLARSRSFAHPSAIDLLLDVAGRTANQAAREAATVTLEKMARGGVYDQLGGGFIATRSMSAWVVPHFEKMLYDNAELLKNYVHAFQSYLDPEFAHVARDIIRWMDAWLTDRERGGFYASQDADINLDDDGDYFTWTRAEAAAVLTPEEMEIAGAVLRHRRPGGHAPQPRENVLHVKKHARCRGGQGRQESGGGGGSVSVRPGPADMRRGGSGRRLLSIPRSIPVGMRWPSPRIWKRRRFCAWLSEKAFALLTLDRLLKEGLGPDGKLAHVISYRGEEQTKRVAGGLDDYAFLIHACLDGWGATGEMKYYQAALDLADADGSGVLRLDWRGLFRCRVCRGRSTGCVARRGANHCRIRRRRPATRPPPPRCCAWKR